MGLWTLWADRDQRGPLTQAPPGWGLARSCPAFQQWTQHLGRAVAMGRPSVRPTAGAAVASAGHSRSQGPHLLGLLAGLPQRVPVTD